MIRTRLAQAVCVNRHGVGCSASCLLLNPSHLQVSAYAMHTVPHVWVAPVADMAGVLPPETLLIFLTVWTRPGNTL